jgi:hypothetical protein
MATRDDYKKVYLEGMGYDYDFVFGSLFIPCEICESQIEDIHHIDGRGMGGTSKVYGVEELQGICRKHHTEYGDKKQYRSYLYWIHYIRMTQRNVAINFDKLPKDLFFDQYSEEQKISSTYYTILANEGYSEEIYNHDDTPETPIEIVIRSKRGNLVTTLQGTDKIEMMTILIQKL